MPSNVKFGTFQLGNRHVSRLGYGAMQLAGLGCLVHPKIARRHSRYCARRLPAA